MRQRIEQIDALRGLAALGVAMFFHAYYVQGHIFDGPGSAFPPLHWLYRWGWTLVDLFFVISGYVFAHVYLDDDGSLRRGVTFRLFWLARIARLYPLHLATLCVCASLAVVAASNGFSDFAAYRAGDPIRFAMNLAFLQVFSGAYNVPSWSLSVEAICYLCFIIAALTGSLRRIAPAMILIGLALAAGHALEPVGRGFIGFFVGYHLWRVRDWKIPLPFLTAVVCIAPLAAFWPDQYHLILLLTLWPALVRLALELPCPAILKWLGDRSYSVYLVHFPIYMTVHILLRGQPPLWPVSTMIVCSLAILISADLSYRCFELPAKRFLTRTPPLTEIRPGTT